MGEVLFVNAPSCFCAYPGTRTNAIVQVYPLLSHSLLGALGKQAGKKVEILDLGIIADWQKALTDKLKEFRPDMVCMTSTTTLFPEVAEVSFFIRRIVGNGVTLIVGGPHATALPEDSLRQSAFDILVAGEGEPAFTAIVSGLSYSDIPGVYYKDGEEIRSTPGYSTVEDINTLPYPAYELYDLNKYNFLAPKMVVRATPMANYMASRGCYGSCSYCNKNIFGRKVRYKTPEVVIDEIKYLLKAGIRELRFVDDMFTANMKKARRICELILENNLKFSWNLASGVRVDCIDGDFLKLAKRAGCYQIGFGFESGDQKSLDSVNKGTTIEQAYKAMEAVNEAGLESVGFFMLGLPADTEDSLKKTIDFAKKLSPTFAKVTITVPFPGTKLFSDYESQGLIKSKDWSKYNFHDIKDIYRHPTLSIETLERYYHKFYYSYYLRPSYLTRTFVNSLRDATFFHYLYYGILTFFPKLFKRNPRRY